MFLKKISVLLVFLFFLPIDLSMTHEGGNRFKAFILANFPYTQQPPRTNNERRSSYIQMQFSLSPPIYGRKPKNHPWAAWGCSSNQSPHLATKWPFSFSSNYVSARLHAVNIKESDRWREIKQLIALQARAARSRLHKLDFSVCVRWKIII